MLRPASSEDVQALARLWEAAWHDAHREHVPPALLPLRDTAYFETAMEACWPRVRLIAEYGAISGFHLIDPPWLDLLFVASAARGTGVAATLLDDAETNLRDAGVTLGQIECLAKNTRALHFYEKHGWTVAGTLRVEVQTPQGLVSLPSVKLEKSFGARR